VTAADTPSLEVESNPAAPHVVKHVQRIMSRTAMAGFFIFIFSLMIFDSQPWFRQLR